MSNHKAETLKTPLRTRVASKIPSPHIPHPQMPARIQSIRVQRTIKKLDKLLNNDASTS